MTKKIGVIGCGWLGLPLAKNLLTFGYKVYGTTTSNSKLEKLEAIGIKAFNIKLHENTIEGNITSFLLNLDTLIINIPPRLRENSISNYVLKMKLLLQEIQQSEIRNIVFVSSTSVYGNITGEITEDTLPKPQTNSGKQLLQSEKIFRKEKNLNTTIVRFGGLIGKDRHPINYLAGKTDLTNGDDVVNLIHLNDCILMLRTIIQKQYWGLLFNGVYPLHPTKRGYYTTEALKRGLPKPKFELSPKKNANKLIISKNYLNKLNNFYTSIIS